MSYVRGLRCRECGREYPQEPVHVCEFCFGPLEAIYDYGAIARDISRTRIASRPLSMWRYRELLPVDSDRIVDLHAGFTPLVPAENLGRAVGLDRLFLKNDCVNPTYSFKDRVVSVAVSKALEFGFNTIACASTGNLACAVAAHGAKAGLETFVFVPANLEQGKIIGAAIYGPTLVAVDGSYDEVNRLCAELGDRYGWAFVNINVRPYYAEGSKTLGFEVAEQLGWRAPDACVVPIASGSLFTKIWKGFQEMVKVGLLEDARPRMFGAQAAGCSPVATAWAAGTVDIRPVRPNTIAKSLAIGNPADGYYALRLMEESHGGAAAVSDAEVVEGIKLLAETEGIFADTVGGVTVASLKKLAAAGAIRRDELTVAYITGNGLKTQEAVSGSLKPFLTIQPTVESFEEQLGPTRLALVTGGRRA